jgi:hypothetical protein
MAVPPTPLPPQPLLLRRATPTFTRRPPTTTACRERLTNRRRRHRPRKAINRRRRRGSIVIRAWPWSSVRCIWPAIIIAVRSTCSNSSSSNSWKSRQTCWHTIIILVSQNYYPYLTGSDWLTLYICTRPYLFSLCLTKRKETKLVTQQIFHNVSCLVDPKMNHNFHI